MLVVLDAKLVVQLPEHEVLAGYDPDLHKRGALSTGAPTRHDASQKLESHAPRRGRGSYRLPVARYAAQVPQPQRLGLL